MIVQCKTPNLFTLSGVLQTLQWNGCNVSSRDERVEFHPFYERHPNFTQSIQKVQGHIFLSGSGRGSLQLRRRVRNTCHTITSLYPMSNDPKLNRGDYPSFVINPQTKIKCEHTVNLCNYRTEIYKYLSLDVSYTLSWFVTTCGAWEIRKEKKKTSDFSRTIKRPVCCFTLKFDESNR